MKVVVSGNDIKNAVLNIIGAAPVNPVTPILNGIFLKAEGRVLTLDATDFSVAATARIPADTEVAGSCLVNAKVFAEILKKIPLDVVILAVKDTTLVIKSDATTFELPLIDLEGGEFPTFNFSNPQVNFLIDPLKFKSLIGKTVWACADDKDGRPVFQGVSLKIDKDILTLLATNTHRLSRVKYQLEEDVEVAENVDTKFIITAAALNILDKMLTDTKNFLKVEFSERAVKFTHANFTLYSRLIDGNFPDTNGLFAKSFTTKIVMDKAELLKASERVKLIAKLTESNQAVFNFSDEGLELRAESYATGKAVEHLNAKVTGADIEIAFNIEYILDFLKATDDEKIILQCTGPLEPAVMVGDFEDNFEYVVTPIRLKETCYDN